MSRSPLDAVKDRAALLGRPLTAAEGYDVLRSAEQAPALDALLTEARERVTAATPAPPAYWAEMTAGLARNLLADGAAPPTRAALLGVAVCALAGAVAIKEEQR